MSKQEKLAALIEAVREYANSPIIKTTAGLNIADAYRKYNATPDDPPQSPEMPECVAKFGMHIAGKIKGGGECGPDTAELLNAVWDHYAQPLKLEVGKCYADANGEVGKVFWFDKAKSLFHAVMLETGIQRHCHADGRSHYQSHPDFVREVKND